MDIVNTWVRLEDIEGWKRTEDGVIVTEKEIARMFGPEILNVGFSYLGLSRILDRVANKNQKEEV